MASSGSSHAGHLDAASGREVVFCHACQHEWYNDVHGLQCPRCTSEICEIITPENDPREIDNGPPPPEAHDHDHDHNHGFYGEGHDSAPDPEEGDIDDHLHNGPNGLFGRRVVFHSPAEQRSRASRGRDERPLADPSDQGDIFRAFTEMLSRDFRVGTTGRSGLESLFPSGSPDQGGDHYAQPAHSIQHRTFSGPLFSGGSTTFTIATGPIQPGQPAPGGAPPRGFDVVFGDIMGSGAVPPPQPNVEGRPLGFGGFALNISDLIATLINPGAAVHGDAVYTQEALDRIITQLMEAHPQSNAAPPASESAIENLEKKKLDKKMMGESGKAECTICIDELNEGDEVVVLPCNHWFHNECVVLWLREHNTCPICRNPIEARNNAGNANAQQPQESEAPPVPTGSRPTHFQTYTSPAWQASDQGHFSSNPSSQQPQDGQTVSQNLERLNAIRNLADPSNRSDPSRPRRDSWSPTSPIGSRNRQRSPSSSSRGPRLDTASFFMNRNDGDRRAWGSADPGQQNRDRAQEGLSRQDRSRQNSSSGGTGNNGSSAMNWFRDRFSGNNSGGGSSNNGRRQS